MKEFEEAMERLICRTPAYDEHFVRNDIRIIRAAFDAKQKRDERPKIIPQKNIIRPKRLEVHNKPGTGLEIYANVQFKAKCVEFTMKEGFQPIVQTEALTIHIGYEPWIQFPDSRWEKMIEQVYQEMVYLWNEKYAK